MKLNKAEKARLEGYYRRKDYTKSRYNEPWMRNYSIKRSLLISSLIKSYKNKTNPSVLDIGCGTGVLLKQLNAIKGNEYKFTGLDFSKDMLNSTCLSLKEQQKINLVHGSAFDTPFPDNHFDVVLCTRFIHQYDNSLKLKLIEEMKRVVKPNGLIMIEFYSYFTGLIKFISDSIFLPEKFNSREEIDEFYIHYTGKKELYNLFKGEVRVEPIVIPMHSLFTKILGINGFNKFNRLVKNLGGKFVFSEYLALATK